MADTIQIVQWALGKRCLLRANDEQVTDPSQARAAVGMTRAYSEAIRAPRSECGIFGNVYVSGYTFGSRPCEDNSTKPVCYPVSGFVISNEFERFGGPDAIARICHECPANVRRHQLADCVGSLFQGVNSRQTEDQLRSIISRLGLESRTAESFPATTPLWYGLWAVSPVPRKALPVLKLLLSEMLKEDRSEMELDAKIDSRQINDFSSIIAAIGLAESRNLDLHVRLSPPGHTDFGYYTKFPHCPFCKARAPVEPWQSRYPAELYTCDVCGTRYSPAETGSRVRMQDERDNLRDILGTEAFRQFARDYLVARGESPEEAAEIVEITEQEHYQRKEKSLFRRELDRRRDQFLQEHIFSGVPCLPYPPSRIPDEESDVHNTKQSTGWFNAENFARVLDRCESYGVRVIRMFHYSSTEENERFELGISGSPADLLAKWKSEGCNERFSAGYNVPDSLIK